MKIIKNAVKAVALSAVVILILNIPMTTKQGIDGVLIVKKIPFYIKAFEFISRDYEYESLAKSITAGKKTDEEKVDAIFEWTVKNIRHMPKGFPVYDDHIWNIIIRQYGEDDQLSDVFTTLVSYSGYKSFCGRARIEAPKSGITLSFVRIGDIWHIFDVYRGKKFIDRGLLDTATPYGHTYREYLNTIDNNKFRMAILRPDEQKIIPRVIFEVKKLIFRRPVVNVD